MKGIYGVKEEMKVIPEKESDVDEEDLVNSSGILDEEFDAEVDPAI